MKKWFNEKREKIKQERGAVVIEATLSLSAFMFVICTLLSITNLCIAQAKIAVAVNETAKEISQYSYIYTLSGLNEIQKANYEAGAENREQMDTIVSSVVDSADALKSLGGEDADYEGTWETLETSYDNVEQIAKKVAEDPKSWAIGMVRVLGNEAYEGVKGVVVGSIAKGLIQKHLVTETGQTADAYLRHLGVVDGIDGLNFNDTVAFQNGTDNIVIVCRYKISLLKLFEQEYTYSFCQSAFTKVWGGKALVEAQEAEEEKVVTDPREMTGEALKQYMIEKYGQGAVDELIAAYGDQVDSWQYDDWEYYMYLYAVSDPEDPRNYTGAKLEEYMIEKYGQGAIDDIKSAYDTSEWSYDDWEYYIYLYASDPLPFSFESKTDYYEYTNKIGLSKDLTNEEKIEIMKEAYERLEDKTDVNCPADPAYIKGFDAFGHAIYDWPDNLGFDMDTVVCISREDALPNKWDRYGSMGGTNFATVPVTGKYTYEERAIPYVENENAYHTGTFNNNIYFDAIDAIYAKDREKLNNVLSDNGVSEVSESEFNEFVNSYYDYLRSLGSDMNSIDAPYGLKGNAASWEKDGAILMSGGAEQIVTPFSGEQLKQLGIVKQTK